MAKTKYVNTRLYVKHSLSGVKFKGNECPLVSKEMPGPGTIDELYHLFWFYLHFESLFCSPFVNVDLFKCI